MRRLCLIWLATLGAGLGAPASAQDRGPVASSDGDDRSAIIIRRLRAIESFEADFKQYTTDSRGLDLDTIEGRIILARPDRLFWHSHTPYEQQLVSNGDKLWFFEPDLDQVTVQPFTADLTKMPAQILNGDFGDLHEDFMVQVVADGGEEHLVLEPRDPQALFTRLVISLGPKTVTALRIDDTLGQSTTITFGNPTRNEPVPPSTFEFTIPEGVDVIEDGQLLAPD